MLFDHCLFLYFRWVHKFIDCLHWFKLAKCGKVLRAINREAAIDEVTIEENEECELDDPDDHEEDDELEKEEIEFEIESAKSGKIIILISINCLVQVKVSQNRTNPPTPIKFKIPPPPTIASTIFQTRFESLWNQLFCSVVKRFFWSKLSLFLTCVQIILDPQCTWN